MKILLKVMSKGILRVNWLILIFDYYIKLLIFMWLNFVIICNKVRN